MKHLFAFILFGYLLSGQEPGRLEEPQTISTEPTEVAARLRMGDKILEEVYGEAVFTPSAGNADDTLIGTLVFKISEAEQRRIAKELKTPVGNVPAQVKERWCDSNF